MECIQPLRGKGGQPNAGWRMGSLSRERINELWPGGGKYDRILNRVSVTWGKSEIRDQTVFGAIKIFCLILEKKNVCLWKGVLQGWRW